jgi:hypothetical protein
MTTTPVKHKILSRVDIRKHADRSGVVTLQYTARATYVAQLYGYGPGVFFALVPSEVPISEEIEQAAAEAGMIASDHPNMPSFKRLVVDALLADATLNAPVLLADLLDAPARWMSADQHELERRHERAMVAVRIAMRDMLDDMRRRALLQRRPAPASEPARRLSPVTVVDVIEEEVETETADDDDVIDAEIVNASTVSVVPVPSTVVAKIADAIAKARKSELQQRLPGGARRHLMKLPAGTYVIAGDRYEPRVDLPSAMADAQEIAHRKESVVVDWDGEYPIVVRRYGAGGRVVYRVEAALKRVAPEGDAS